MRAIRYALPFFFVLMLSACAGVAPVPGGNETVNAEYYDSAEDFKERVDRLQVGMPEPLVLALLDRKRRDLMQLSRNEIVTALFGANAMQLLGEQADREENQAFLQSLYGYRLEYKDVQKSHGFSSVIRILTKEEGFNYKVNLIFRHGKLLEKPDVSGGIVNGSQSRTFFDYINPGSVMGRI